MAETYAQLGIIVIEKSWIAHRIVHPGEFYPDFFTKLLGCRCAHFNTHEVDTNSCWRETPSPGTKQEIVLW